VKANFKNTAVIVPVYNSEKYLEELFGRIFKFVPKRQVVVVNDASEDSSKQICEGNGVQFVDLKTNCGKGNAIQLGFEKAREKGFHFAFTIDSDLQHKPEDFPNFIQKQNEINADMIIGKRDFSLSKMPFMRILSNTITSGIISIVSKNKIYDSQSGYRLYNLNTVKNMNFVSKRYQFESEVIIKIAKQNGEIGFTKIDTIYDGQKSYISHFRDIKDFVKIVLYELKN